MPLVQGSGKQALSANIATERKSGRPEKQAVAIAYSTARKSAKRAGRADRVRRLMKGE